MAQTATIALGCELKPRLALASIVELTRAIDGDRHHQTLLEVEFHVMKAQTSVVELCLAVGSKIEIAIAWARSGVHHLPPLRRHRAGQHHRWLRSLPILDGAQRAGDG